MKKEETESYHFDKAVKSSRTRFLGVLSMIVIAAIIGFGCMFVLCAWGGADTRGGSGTTVAAAGTKQVDTDPVGGKLAYLISKPVNYRIVIFVVYGLLASMSFAIVLRYLLFWMSFRKKELFFPGDEIKKFSKPEGTKPADWITLRNTVLDQDKDGKSFFWASLKDGVMSRPVDQESKYDQLIVFFRHRVSEIMFRYIPRRAYDTITAISPATGFFGTLLGLLYIFGTMKETMVHPSKSEEFATGLTVAVITSLWGLFNLGLAVLMSYFAQCRVDRRAAEMEMYAKPVTALAESCAVKEEGSRAGN